MNSFDASNITVSFTFPGHNGNESQLETLTTEERHGSVLGAGCWGTRGGVTGCLDSLLHFALKSAISGVVNQSEARFQAMLVRPGATDHLP